MTIKTNTDNFQAFENETQVGQLDFEIDGRTMVIPHTVVFDGNEGKGIGKALVKAAVAYAEAHQLTVNLLLCQGRHRPTKRQGSAPTLLRTEKKINIFSLPTYKLDAPKHRINHNYSRILFIFRTFSCKPKLSTQDEKDRDTTLFGMRGHERHRTV